MKQVPANIGRSCSLGTAPTELGSTGPEFAARAGLNTNRFSMGENYCSLGIDKLEIELAFTYFADFQFRPFRP